MPSLAQSMDTVMRVSGAELSALDLYFEACIPAPPAFETKGTGQAAGGAAPTRSATVRLVELVPGGSEKKVSVANRAEFVDAYLRLLLDDGVKHLSVPLCSGFHAICDAHSLDTLYFRPEELEQLLCGHREWSNLLELESGARYIGFDADSPAVRNFWSVVHDRRRFPKEKQRRLLWFATGSDRVPIRGLADLHFTIQRSTSDDQRLPSAHACFNMIDLPEYSSIDVLAARLDTALEHTQGFGLV
jgi:ubiquitin-protein ligase E3 A